MKHFIGFFVLFYSSGIKFVYRLNLNLHVMEARENLRKERDDLKNYLSQINYDGMFFKGQMILSGILVFLFVIYFVWLA